MKIESLNNDKVKNWVKLKEKKYRDKEKLFIVEGNHLVNEALKNGIVKELICLNDNNYNMDIPTYIVTDAIMKKISSQITSTNIMAICYKLNEKEINGNVCILDGIQDPGNLGTIIRSAVAFDIDTIILSNDTVDLYNDKVIRASEGMIFNINIIRNDLEDEINKLKNSNYRIYGTLVNNGILLNEIDFNDKVAIIIGNEGNGMNDNIKNLCDSFINIPISKSCESLNAGVAASIIFYEINR